MGIKKKSKVTAEFNMSSLTDIIFLLLIFFMLTSSMIVPNALNLQLPGQKKSNSTSKSTPSSITIETDGSYYWNGTRISASQLEKSMADLKRQKRNDAVVSITPSGNASNVDVVRVLDMAYRYEIKTSLNDPR